MKNPGIWIFLMINLSFYVTGTESLKCFKCLNLECPEGGDGEKNENLCQSVRSYIVRTLSAFYELGPTGYLGQCPPVTDTLQWTLRTTQKELCPPIKESETCSLGRIQVVSEEGSNTIISHATILGCAKSALLYYMRQNTSNKQVCSLYGQNSTNENSYAVHKLQLENCPKPTEYCKGKDFCIPHSESVVKPFVTNNGNKSFEAGIIISIVVIVIVIIGVVLLASYCKNPLSRSTNYSPAEVQSAAIPVPSTSSSDTTGNKLNTKWDELI